MIPQLAWRNIWRNKLRSSVVILSVALGIFAGIFLIALTNGMINARIDAIISTEVSHIQIHLPGFEENNDIKLLMKDADRILRKVKQNPNVAAASKRYILNAMASSAETGTGVKLVGIDPVDERRISNVSDKVIEGNYLIDSGRNPVLIGQRLAKKLNVGLKNKIILTLQDAENNITAGAFRVVGIYETDNFLFDEAVVFVRNKDLCRLIALDENDAHEIGIILDENSKLEEAQQKLAAGFPKLSVEEWRKLSPEAGYLVSAMNQYLFIIMIVILLALCFGIINTMLMVVMERMRELGMLMAIGMSHPRVFLMIMLETVFLSLTGGVVGITLGYATSEYLANEGLDLYFWQEAYASIGYSSLIYPAIDWGSMLVTAVMIIITGVFSALYPAYKALRLNPADAIR